MKEQGSGKLTNLPTVTQGVRAKPESESRTVWLQNPCSFCTGFWVVHMGPSQVSTCFPGTPRFTFSLSVDERFSSSLRTLQGVYFVSPWHFSGPKILFQRNYTCENAPFSLQSSKSLVIANLTEIWVSFLLLKQSRGPSVEMTGLWVLYDGL